ncbi:MAG: hypothetical protein HYW78_02080 [Parcubacteria group bacterium]|nr:hypothetical protein [Parcubacteria group bacterium]
MNYEIPILGTFLFEHGYFSAEKFLVLAPVALAMVQKERASTEFRNSRIVII